jgi:hypothetical protein
MSLSEIIAKKEAFLERLAAAEHTDDMQEIRKCLGELQFLMRAEYQTRLTQTRLDWLDQRRSAASAN